MNKPSVDHVLDALDDALKGTVGESWDMNNIEIDQGGCTMTVTFWDCKEEDGESQSRSSNSLAPEIVSFVRDQQVLC